MTKAEKKKINGEIGILLFAREHYAAEVEKAYDRKCFARAQFYQGYVNAYEDEIRFLRELLKGDEK